MRILILDDNKLKAEPLKERLALINLESDLVCDKNSLLEKINIEYDYFCVDYFLNDSPSFNLFNGEKIAKILRDKHPLGKVIIYSACKELANNAEVMDFNDVYNYILNDIRLSGGIISKKTDKLTNEIADFKNEIINFKKDLGSIVSSMRVPQQAPPQAKQKKKAYHVPIAISAGTVITIATILLYLGGEKERINETVVSFKGHCIDQKKTENEMLSKINNIDGKLDILIKKGDK